MKLAVKICGIKTIEALDAAATGGARYIGFVFYPPSPRNIAAADAAGLAARLPATISKVGLFVDADDVAIAATLAAFKLDMLQFHGGESPERVRDVKRRFGLPVMKAIAVGARADLDRADLYRDVADWLLFDARPPARPGSLPGGNAVSFDWTLLTGRRWPLPWMLSGGLTPQNVADAIRISGAAVVDVSSGVEDRPGVKSPAKIAAFIAAAKSAGN